jgi:hypothetical protein
MEQFHVVQMMHDVHGRIMFRRGGSGSTPLVDVASRLPVVGCGGRVGGAARR